MKPSVCHGIALWMDWVMDEENSTVISTGPGEIEASRSYLKRCEVKRKTNFSRQLHAQFFILFGNEAAYSFGSMRLPVWKSTSLWNYIASYRSLLFWRDTCCS
ncbi:hypothetical protein ISN44_As11g008270 [Arabidopsis suecica]|uniref:Uncharacterized protein n=1 Tax=Arabidopsis suecica TaxID=45249 RepID=A0A8T1Z8D0_ARASU|nr:hypothetical protein ISN44_As11g008270 [Arabidopsis suecica]